MKFFDLLCAGSLFLFAVGASLLIPKTYADRIWLYGTDLALLFAAMLNLLRIRYGAAMWGGGFTSPATSPCSRFSSR